MILIKITSLIFITWLFLMVIIPFIIFPNYLFKSKIKQNNLVDEILSKLKSRDRETTVKNIYYYIVEKNYGLAELNILEKVKSLPNLFFNKIECLDKNIFLFCHTQNYYLKTLLLNSGQFSKNQIKIKWTISKNLIIHQYLIIDLNSKKIKLDPFYKVNKLII